METRKVGMVRRIRGGAGTLASAVYDQLRRDVIAGVLKPEEKLRIDTLKEMYQTGSTPIREALNRLTAEGLVVQYDQKGFQVPPVSLEDLEDLTRARAMIYNLMLGEAIAHGDLAWEEGIVLAFHRLSRTPEYVDANNRTLNPEWSDRHREFHRALIVACNSRWLLKFSDTLLDHADRYQFLSLVTGAADRQLVLDEHRELMDCVINRDAERATRLVNKNFSHTMEAARRWKSKATAQPETLAANG
jgi:DNA-binding GntR family transcriptional regulator